MRDCFRCAATVLLQALTLNFLAMSIAQANTPPGPPVLVGTSEKVCQLDGNVDWETGAPTAALTLTNAGLDAADLGFPVEYGGNLVLLFGDSWPSHPSGIGGILGANDAVGVTTRTATPTSSACIGMTVNHYATTPPTFDPSTIIPANVVDQGWFNVPSGGVTVGGYLDGFFWTNHCVKPHKLLPSPGAPLARPAAGGGCPETPLRNSIGWNVIARSTDNARTFHNATPMPVGFVYAIGVTSGSNVYILGVPRYRASTPYLAVSTPASIMNPGAWRYFAGRNALGNPIWVNYGAWVHGAIPVTWSPPGNAEILYPVSSTDRCIGEFSVTWNAPMNAWLMLYNCAGHIDARIAREIWGPWSAPTSILAYGPSIECKLVMATTGCGARRNYYPLRPGGTYVNGGLYAPFVINRYTTSLLPGAVGATIYWTVSTWNPYEVDLMRTTLESP